MYTSPETAVPDPPKPRRFADFRVVRPPPALPSLPSLPFLPPLPTPRISDIDGVPDSCSDDSEDDEPELLTQVPLQPKNLNGESSRHQGAPQSRVSATVGRGGKIVYNVSQFEGTAKYYMIQWRKPQQKKHKTWDGDAYLKVEGSAPGAKMVMFSEEGNIMATSRLSGLLPVEGCDMRIGPFDTECDREMTEAEFKAATAILNRPQASRTVPAVTAPPYAPPTFAKAFKAPTQTHTPRPQSGLITKHTPSQQNGMPAPPMQSAGGGTTTSKTYDSPGSSTVGRTVAQSSFYAPRTVAKPIVIGDKRSEEQRQKWGGALHDPSTEGAVVMQRPPDKQARMMKTELRDVVIDPLLSEKMRDHQKEGVKFMYNCVMGLTGAEGQGCILADEMGLGKTLQTIALIWTLLRQSPFSDQIAVIGKALVVCPVTLVSNWQKEFRKWLGTRPQLQVLAATATDDKVNAFVTNPSAQVLIIGYERLRKVIKHLASCQPPIDLIVCDEGHRLKSNKKDNKTTRMFDALRTQRRIILSGTPVQNELSEYWAMVDFCCPGIFGSYNLFNKQYENPIMKSRSPGCSDEAREEGQMKADALSKLSREFVLRRTAAVLDNYLPPKHEYVVFVAPSVLQIKVLRELLSRETAFDISEQKFAFGLIDFMRKITNSPMLISMKNNAIDEGVEFNEALTTLEKAKAVVPRNLNANDVTTSGKMSVLDRMVHTFWTTTTEKVVIVSNWTSTLDMIQNLCKLRKWPFLRLDGSTSAKQRQPFVDQFNREMREQSFVFLLSAKAGGTGLNLIGASRLILFDSDWNPSTDLQAMARIHRDGQKHPVYIYRLLTTNTIDEKIYQRQIYKTALSDQMMDQEKRLPETKDSFTRAELQDIFTLNLQTDGCQTHDLLGCDCQSGNPVGALALDPPADDDSSDEERSVFMPASQFDPQPSAKMKRKSAQEQQDKLAALKNWRHIDPFKSGAFSSIADTVLYNMIWDDLDRTGPMTGQTSIAVSEAPTPRTASSEPSSDDECLRATKKQKVGRHLTHDEFDIEWDWDNARRPSKVGNDTSSSRFKRKSGGSEVSINTRRHNLLDIANAGQAGRVMFVFERLSASKMGPDEDDIEE